MIKIGRTKDLRAEGIHSITKRCTGIRNWHDRLTFEKFGKSMPL
jgi:hypothetical protein